VKGIVTTFKFIADSLLEAPLLVIVVMLMAMIAGVYFVVRLLRSDPKTKATMAIVRLRSDIREVSFGWRCAHAVSPDRASVRR
jgi:hypothetical protein